MTMPDDVPERRAGPRPGVTDLDRAAETVEMLRMRQMGASYESIARHFNLNRKTVWERVTKYLRDMPADEAETLRAMEARRYDEYERRLQDGIIEGDTKAITAAIRLSERRCKLLGLDMPQRHEVQVDGEATALAEQVVAALTDLAALSEQNESGGAS